MAHSAGPTAAVRRAAARPADPGLGDGRPAWRQPDGRVLQTHREAGRGRCVALLGLQAHRRTFGQCASELLKR